MIFKSYPKGDAIGSGSYVFRHYGETGELSRFAQFVEGTLEELTEEDFEGVNTLNAGCLSYSGIEYGGITGTHTQLALKSIIIPDTVTKLNVPSTVNAPYYFISDCPNLVYVKFPKNLPIQPYKYTLVCHSNNAPVVDFSDYTTIPSFELEQSDTAGVYINGAVSFSRATIRVPSSLLSSWKAAWKNKIDSNATYEGV